MNRLHHRIAQIERRIGLTLDQTEIIAGCEFSRSEIAELMRNIDGRARHIPQVPCEGGD